MKDCNFSEVLIEEKEKMKSLFINKKQFLGELI